MGRRDCRNGEESKNGEEGVQECRNGEEGAYYLCNTDTVHTHALAHPHAHNLTLTLSFTHTPHLHTSTPCSSGVLSAM